LPVSSPAKILAVDNEADFELLIRQRFRRQIRAEEFTFRFAHHGEEALGVLGTEPDIELMLLDINMPVMDGLTLLNELRERQSPVRAIIVSAYGDMTNLRTAMNRGAFDFVTKPVDLDDLEITIRKSLAEIAKLRDLDCRRAAAERARSNLSRHFSPNVVEMLALSPRAPTCSITFFSSLG
jgi:adenylate cyclase